MRTQPTTGVDVKKRYGRELFRGEIRRILKIYKGEGEGGIWDDSSFGASLTKWSGVSINQEFTFKMYILHNKIPDSLLLRR